MHFSPFTPTDMDVVQHISENFTYPVKNEYESNYFHLSHDIGLPEVIQMMVRIHNLVEHLAKSAQEAVKFETTIHEKRFLEITPPGEALYHTLLLPHRFAHLPRQQLSEALKAWDDVSQRILGPTPNFQGNPMRPMNAQGVTEGELMNAQLIRIREATGRKIYKSEQLRRSKEAQKACNAKTKLVDRLHELHPGLFGLKIALMYSQDFAGKVRLKESTEHIQKLMEALNNDLWFGKSVGYIWTRHYLSEAGYRYNLVLLFDPSITPAHTIDSNYVLQEWQASTKGAGLDCLLANYVRNADELFHDIKCSQAAERYIRLSPDATFPHYGVSELPSAKSLSELEQEPPTHFGSRGEFGGNDMQDLSLPLNNRFTK